MKTWNEFTGITTNKIYKLLHNGGIKYKHSIRNSNEMDKNTKFLIKLFVTAKYSIGPLQTEYRLYL